MRSDCSINKRKNSAATSQERELNNSSALHALLLKQTCPGSDRAISEPQLKNSERTIFHKENVSSTKSEWYMRTGVYF